jgi:asparagine synthase (glutamine-hydrolysing)
MCGIGGYFGNYDGELLRRMNASQAHRGPDDEGTYCDGANGVGLAHRRLSIIDLSSAGHQPMRDTTGMVALVFNGEIYNYRELRDELVIDGFRFVGTSDTEVLLAQYLKDGVECLKKLKGVFAFAVWDGRQKHLFLARDAIGVKPLYYTETGKGFLFASEMKALLEAPDVDRCANLAAIHRTLTFLWSPFPETAMKNVWKLEPGSALIVREGRIARRWFYYDLPYRPAVRDPGEENAVRLVEQSVEDAVTRQLVADVPVGAFLSGGLDSSSVAAIASQHIGGNRLQCFTIGFQDGREWMGDDGSEDLRYARQVAGLLGADLHVVWADAGMVRHLEKVIYHLDEPQADPAPIHVSLICELARAKGIKVMLSGTGGDDIFGGYRRHGALIRERYWRGIPQFGRTLASYLAARIPPASVLLRRISKAFRYAQLGADERLISYFYWYDPKLLSFLYEESMLLAVGRAPIQEPMQNTLAHMPGGCSPLSRMLYLETKHFLCDHNLNYTDKLSMAHGVEVRVPLIDEELVARAARLPDKYRVRHGVSKWIFKKAMEHYLPQEVCYRRKVGFGAPIRRWVRGDLRQMVDDYLSESALKARGMFSPEKVRKLIDDDRSGRVDASYTIFSLICVEMWSRLFIDRKGL